MLGQRQGLLSCALRELLLLGPYHFFVSVLHVGEHAHGVHAPLRPYFFVAANANLALSAAEPAAAQPEVVVPDPLPEPYTSLFKQAREAPTEFNTWTSLISAAEKLVRLSLFAVAKAL